MQTDRQTSPTTDTHSYRKNFTDACVYRCRCAKCGSPMFASMGKRMVVLPLALFDKVDTHGEAWRPQHHMYYDDRVVDVADDLPKFKGSSRHERWVPP